MSDNVLDGLPEVKFFMKCMTCGSSEWTRSKLDKDNRVVTECNRCPDKSDWSPIDVPEPKECG